MNENSINSFITEAQNEREKAQDSFASFSTMQGHAAFMKFE